MLLLFYLVLHLNFILNNSYDEYEYRNKVVLKYVKDRCINNVQNSKQWWNYEWCSEKRVVQFHLEEGVAKDTITLDIFQELDQPSSDNSANRDEIVQTFRGQDLDCLKDNVYIQREAEVKIRCCNSDSLLHTRTLLSQIDDEKEKSAYITGAIESSPCKYQIYVCCVHMCFEYNEKGDIISENEDKDNDILSFLHLPRETEIIEDNIASESYSLEKIRENKLHPSNEDEEEEEEENTTRDHTHKHGENKDFKWISPETQLHYREKTRKLFYHAYESYMKYAFPAGELKPLSCTGGNFDLIKIPLVTLFDTLDTLVIIGNYSEFIRVVNIIESQMPTFDIDVNVSLFETNIRILGGLLSAHLMAVDPRLGIYQSRDLVYNNFLLDLAINLGDRLLPAFKTATGIPYGTVNLRHGVPPRESELASLAGAGTLLIEFEILSTLTGNPIYGKEALKATVALYECRSPLGLMGKHINVQTAKWHESSSGIGSNADSYYEYLFKSYLLFHSELLFNKFSDLFIAIKKYVQIGNWFSETDIFNLRYRKHRFESLQAFWPGLEANMGILESSARLLNTFYSVWNEQGLLPEEMDYKQVYSQSGPNPNPNPNPNPGETTSFPSSSHYPLRPELIESTYHHYRASGDNSWLSAGISFLTNLEGYTWTECGFATVNNIAKHEHHDSMPSFLLSETIKYLYLLFDEDNFIHDRSYIFSTEAHPFDTLQINILKPKNYKHFEEYVRNSSLDAVHSLQSKLRILPTKCRKRFWYESALSSYIPTYNDLLISEATLNPNAFTEKFDTWYENIPGFFDTRSTDNKFPPAISRPKKPETCYGPDPRLKNSSHNNNNNNNKQPNKQTVTPSAPINVNIGALGEFSIQIQNDGFVIKSLVDGNTVTISNIGKGAVHVSDTGGNSHLDNTPEYTVTGTAYGSTLICRLQLFHPSISWLYSDMIVPLSQYVFKQKFCSISAFGPTVNLTSSLADIEGSLLNDHINETHLQFESLYISGEISLASDHKGCPNETEDMEKNAKQSAASKPWAPWSWVRKGINLIEKIRKKTEESESESESTPTSSSSSSSSSSSQDNSDVQDETTVNEKNLEYPNKILISQRGGCLFEEKVKNAQDKGAKANIVVNTEDSIFIMAGKQANKDPKKIEPVQDLSGINISSAMISMRDGIDIYSAFGHLKRKKNLKLHLSLQIDSLPNILDSEALGYDQYPKIRISNNIVVIQTRGQWAALLTSSGKEWQLFIIPKYELPLTVSMVKSIQYDNEENLENREESSQTNKVSMKDKSVTQSLTNNPLEIYLRSIKRKCPSYISVDKKDVYLNKKVFYANYRK